MVTHIAYELEALERAVARPGKRLELEALLVHARNLREFFWKEWDPFDKFADSDVLAEHYFPSPSRGGALRTGHRRRSSGPGPRSTDNSATSRGTV